MKKFHSNIHFFSIADKYLVPKFGCFWRLPQKCPVSRALTHVRNKRPELIRPAPVQKNLLSRRRVSAGFADGHTWL